MINVKDMLLKWEFYLLVGEIQKAYDDEKKSLELSNNQLYIVKTFSVLHLNKYHNAPFRFTLYVDNTSFIK